MQQYPQAVARYFPPGTKITRPNGGWVLGVELAPSVNALEFVDLALQEKIIVAPGLIRTGAHLLRDATVSELHPPELRPVFGRNPSSEL